MSEWRSLFCISTVKPRWLHMVYVKTNIFLNIIVWIAFINIINNSNKYIWSSPILTRLWYGCFHCRYHINTASIPQILVIIINNTVNQSPQQDILAEKKKIHVCMLKKLKILLQGCIYLFTKQVRHNLKISHCIYVFVCSFVCLLLLLMLGFSVYLFLMECQGSIYV